MKALLILNINTFKICAQSVNNSSFAQIQKDELLKGRGMQNRHINKGPTKSGDT